jgi:Beta-galactosidase/PEP-CTERM motif
MEEREMSYRCPSRANQFVPSRQNIVKLLRKVQNGRISKNLSAWSVCSAAAVLGLLLFAPPAQAQLPSDDFFPIGVFAQPVPSFDKWKSRGINTLFQYEPQVNAQGVPTATMEQWSKAAADRQLYYTRLPSANPANDLQEKYLLAWTQHDEPDLENHDPNPARNIDIYQNLKAIGPNKPVWINFAGNHVTPAGANYTEWVKSGDWLSHDWYPFNANPTRYPIDLIGQGIDKLRADSKGVPKKFFAVIESSNQKLNSLSRAPTTDEFRGEIWEAIVHGAGGIVYFPQKIGGGFQYDDTPANLVIEMQNQNAKIKSFGRVLNLAYNPGSITWKPSTAQLEGTWRDDGANDYFFILNESPTLVDDGQMTITGVSAGVNWLEVVGENRVVQYLSGKIVDDFAPYQVHVYRANVNVTPASVPEPATLGMLAMIGTCFAARRRRAA